MSEPAERLLVEWVDTESEDSSDDSTTAKSSSETSEELVGGEEQEETPSEPVSKEPNLTEETYEVLDRVVVELEEVIEEVVGGETDEVGGETDEVDGETDEVGGETDEASDEVEERDDGETVASNLAEYKLTDPAILFSLGVTLVGVVVGIYSMWNR